MKREKFLKLVSLSGMALLAVPSCTELELDSSSPEPSANNLTNDTESIGQITGKFHSGVGGHVPVADAKAWTQEFLNKNSSDNYFHISRADLLELMESEDCDGVMFYLASSDEEKLELVLSGTNQSGQRSSNDPFGVPGTRDNKLF